MLEGELVVVPLAVMPAAVCLVVVVVLLVPVKETILEEAQLVILVELLIPILLEMVGEILAVVLLVTITVAAVAESNLAVLDRFGLRRGFPVIPAEGLM